MVWGADVNIWQGVRAVEEFRGSAEVRDRLPDEERLGTSWIQDLSPTENRGHEVDAAGWRAV